jgi:predicted phosphodiesterase
MAGEENQKGGTLESRLVLPIGIVADIHGNLYALQNIMEAFEKLPPHLRPKSLVFLGDSSGYGPWPVESTRAVMERFNIILLGNHDKAVLEYGSQTLSNGVDILFKNPIAQQAIACHRRKYEVALQATGIDYIRHFAERPTIYTSGDMIFVHGSPGTPDEHLDHGFDPGYAKMPADVEEYLQDVGKTLFVGHTHLPTLIRHKIGNTTQHDVCYYPWNVPAGHFDDLPDRTLASGHVVNIRQFRKSLVWGNEKVVVNFGAGGWPRDGLYEDTPIPDENRYYAKAGVITKDAYVFLRVDYDMRKAAQDIRADPGLSGVILAGMLERSL